MSRYCIRMYSSDFDTDQVRIGIEVSRHWIWPYAHDAESLRRLIAKPGFDPHLWLYALCDDQVIGFVGAAIDSTSPGKPIEATIFFPRVTFGHEQASGLLLAAILDVLRDKQVTYVTGRVTTMCRQELRLAEKAGFAFHDWGHKMYYAYEAEQGKLPNSGTPAVRLDPDRDLQSCSRLAALWYKCSIDWCRECLQAHHEAGIIAHLGVRRDGELIASCLAAANEIRPTTAALYYIYAPDKPSLTALLNGAVNACIEHGADRLIADLIHEHRTFEPVYRKLGFKKAADWARCEKLLTPSSKRRNTGSTERD